MTTQPRQLADPQTLARIARLELRARAVVEGVISGMHRSPHRQHKPKIFPAFAPAFRRGQRCKRNEYLGDCNPGNQPVEGIMVGVGGVNEEKIILRAQSPGNDLFDLNPLLLVRRGNQIEGA